MTDMTEYAERDLDAIGEHYAKHVSAMTLEGLHAKSAIAAELAWRDAEIERLRSCFTKLDKPKYKGDPMLDSVLAKPNPQFRAWVDSLPPEYWTRYDLSAARIGWEAARKLP